MAIKRTLSKAESIEVNLSDIEWIKSTLSNMNLKIQEVDNSLNKLNQTVIGDEIYGQIGLIKKVEEHNTYIENDKQFKSRLIGGGLVITFVWGLILKFFKI